MSPRRRSGGGARAEGGDARQEDTEGRPPALFALDLDRAPALADDAVRGREPEPGALADLLRGEERLEDAQPRLLVHPGAGVVDLDRHVRPREELDVARRD